MYAGPVLFVVNGSLAKFCLSKRLYGSYVLRGNGFWIFIALSLHLFRVSGYRKMLEEEVNEIFIEVFIDFFLGRCCCFRKILMRMEFNRENTSSQIFTSKLWNYKTLYLQSIKFVRIDVNRESIRKAIITTSYGNAKPLTEKQTSPLVTRFDQALRDIFKTSYEANANKWAVKCGMSRAPDAE